MTSQSEEPVLHSFDGCPMCEHHRQELEVADGSRCGGCWSPIASWDTRAKAGRCGNCVSLRPAVGGARHGQGRTE